MSDTNIRKWKRTITIDVEVEYDINRPPIKMSYDVDRPSTSFTSEVAVEKYLHENLNASVDGFTRGVQEDCTRLLFDALSAYDLSNTVTATSVQLKKG